MALLAPCSRSPLTWPLHIQNRCNLRAKRSTSFVCCSKNAGPREATCRRIALIELALGVVFYPCVSKAAESTAVALPQDYQDLAYKLVEALQESIRLDLTGVEEREVRRKADTAKDLVKQFVRNWRDNRLVRGDESHTQITAAIQELGLFYSEKGPRARLTQEVGENILHKLDGAALALPIREENASLFGLFQ